MSVFSAWIALISIVFATAVAAIPTSYDNVFLDPHWILTASNWNNANTTAASQAIVSGADDLALQGPWSVLNKTILPPSNNTLDYLSFAPYWWPNCSNVHNATQLTQYQVWTECVYQERDGQFVPDQHLVNDTGHISALGDSVLYAAIAWAITGDNKYASDISYWINTWFVDETSAQTPNLNYAQLIRGVGEMKGAHTGLLDFKGMAKIATGILALRAGNAAGWSSTVDAGFQAWIKQYLVWITTASIAIQEMDSLNNHGSYFYNQWSSLYLLINDQANATAVLAKYFDGIFQGQIDANGEQPYEAVRTHPYHYRAYNLAAAITNARIAAYLGVNYYNYTTKAGGTIQMAIDYAMVQDPTKSNETDAVPEMWPIVAFAVNQFGDPSGKYRQFLASTGAPNSEAFQFWDFAGTVNGSATPTTTGLSSKPTSGHDGGSMASARVSVAALALGAVGLALSLF